MISDELYDTENNIRKFQSRIALTEDKLRNWTICENERIKKRYQHKLARYDIILLYLQVKHRKLVALKNIGSK